MIDTHEANDSLAEQDASQPNTGHQEAKAPDAPTGDAKEESPEEGASEEPKKVPFRELPLCDAVQDGLDAMGFEMATPIQSLAIPPTTEGERCHWHRTNWNRQDGSFSAANHAQHLRVGGRRPHQVPHHHANPRTGLANRPGLRRASAISRALLASPFMAEGAAAISTAKRTP